MDFNKLALDLDTKVYTDIKLILIDGKSNTIEINVHKIVLVFSSEFFYSLFKFRLEKNKSEVTVMVDDVKIAQEVILSFYGKEIVYGDIVHKLMIMMCQDYFGTKINISLLMNNKIPENLFELFLHLIGSSKLDNGLLMTIKNNIPANYDLNKLPRDMIEKLLLKEISKFYLMYRGMHDQILISDTEKIGKWFAGFGFGDAVAISNNCDKIITGAWNGRIWMHNMEGQVLFSIDSYTESIDYIIFSKDDKNFLSVSDHGKINIWDSETGNNVTMFDMKKGSRFFDKLFFLDDGIYVAFVAEKSSEIELWNIITHSLIFVYPLTNITQIRCLEISNDKKIIMYSSHWDNIDIININSKITHQLKIFDYFDYFDSGKIKIKILPGNQTALVYSYGKNIILFYDIISGILIKDYRYIDKSYIYYVNNDLEFMFFFLNNDEKVDILDSNQVLLKSFQDIHRSRIRDFGSCNLDIKLRKCLTDN